MYFSEHVKKHAFVWEPKEKINLTELAVWKDFSEMGTSVLNAESSGEWVTGEARRKAFLFLFVRFSVYIEMDTPVWLIWCHF